MQRAEMAAWYKIETSWFGTIHKGLRKCGMIFLFTSATKRVNLYDETIPLLYGHPSSNIEYNLRF